MISSIAKLPRLSLGNYPTPLTEAYRLSAAVAGLIDLIHKGRFTPKDTVVFIHSGGIPALFTYDKEIIKQSIVTSDKV